MGAAPIAADRWTVFAVARFFVVRAEIVATNRGAVLGAILGVLVVVACAIATDRRDVCITVAVGVRVPAFARRSSYAALVITVEQAVLIIIGVIGAFSGVVSLEGRVFPRRTSSDSERKAHDCEEPVLRFHGYPPGSMLPPLSHGRKPPNRGRGLLGSG